MKFKNKSKIWSVYMSGRNEYPKLTFDFNKNEREYSRFPNGR
jgi:hypothetical protein